MRIAQSTLAIATIVAAAMAAPASAQMPTNVVEDLLRDVGQVREKVVGLAKAMPESAYDWRPGEGVRSVGEVYLHVAADNWYLAGEAGPHAPAATGIVAGDYSTAEKYEQQKLGKDAIIAELEKSFAFLEENLRNTKPDQLNANVAFFGRQTPVRSVWVMTVTHMHEHLGQSIAYARSNGVVPPWSR